MGVFALSVLLMLTISPEQGWTELIQSRMADWKTQAAPLTVSFAPIEPPEFQIVLRTGGNRDAFTLDERTIAFDVSKLHALYGDATLPENRDRIDRFFRHEYVHLLQKAWLKKHPYPADTPLRAALLAIWTEGLGNYYSLSPRWHGESKVARDTLARLGPRFVARLAALACASDEKLIADLSEGPFEEKWGALPAALWLRSESIEAFVNAGPDGVWELAGKHLPADLRAALHEARGAAALCESP